MFRKKIGRENGIDTLPTDRGYNGGPHTHKVKCAKFPDDLKWPHGLLGADLYSAVRPDFPIVLSDIPVSWAMGEGRQQYRRKRKRAKTDVLENGRTQGYLGPLKD